MSQKVLVTAAGSIVAQGIIKSLKLANSTAGTSYRIISCDMSPDAAGLYRTETGLIVPSSNSPGYIDAVIAACRKHEVQAVFCGSDDELLVLSGERVRIEKESGAKVLVGELGALALARDKWETYRFCRQNRLPSAPSSLPEDGDGLAREYGYPVVVKPREGYGSLHVYITHDAKEMAAAVSAISKAGWHPMVQKFIPGDQEFTTGITVDSTCRYVMSSISMRKVIKNGQTHKAFIDSFVEVRKSAELVAQKLGTSGPINVQAKVGPGSREPQVIEINPRFSASCPMRAVAGINEPDIVFQNAVLGRQIKAVDYKRLFCARYLNEVYVPLASYEAAKGDPGKAVEGSGSFIADYF